MRLSVYAGLTTPGSGDSRQERFGFKIFAAWLSGIRVAGIKRHQFRHQVGCSTTAMQSIGPASCCGCTEVGDRTATSPVTSFSTAGQVVMGLHRRALDQRCSIQRLSFMWIGIQMATTMTAVVRGSMAWHRGSGTASAAAGTGSVVAGLIVGMTAGTGLRAEALTVSGHRRLTACIAVAGGAGALQNCC